MKKIMEVYGELVLGLTALAFLLILLGIFFTDGTVSGMVEETVDAILGNTAAYEEHMGEAAPEAAWTGERPPAGSEAPLLAYMQIKTAGSSGWTSASRSLEEGFTDFEVIIEAVRKISGGTEEVAYDAESGRCRLPSEGIYQINLTVADKERRISSVSLCMIAE